MSESTKTKSFSPTSIATKIRRRPHAQKVEMASSFHCATDFAPRVRPTEWRCGTCGLVISDPCGPCVGMMAENHEGTHVAGRDEGESTRKDR